MLLQSGWAKWHFESEVKILKYKQKRHLGEIAIYETAKVCIQVVDVVIILGRGFY